MEKTTRLSSNLLQQSALLPIEVIFQIRLHFDHTHVRQSMEEMGSSCLRVQECETVDSDGRACRISTVDRVLAMQTLITIRAGCAQEVS